MKAHLERMFRAMSWADRQALAALQSCAAAQADALPLLAHLLAAEHVWLARLEQRAPRVAVWPQLTTDECAQLAADNEAGYTALLARLNADELQVPLTYRNTKGQEFITRVLDILTHVVIHGAYHRGQIARCIGRNGGVAPDTDFIIFARQVEPNVA